MFRIESLLSARLFLRPQLVGERIFFISNLSGHLSLYAMDYGSSVPEPLLPPNIALQNPHLVDGKSFYVFAKLGKILVMIDKDGDENYQPMLIPMEGGFPEPAFKDSPQDCRFFLEECDPDRTLVYMTAPSHTEQKFTAYRGTLKNGMLEKLGESPYGCDPSGMNREHTRAVLVDSYTLGDNVLYLWEQGLGRRLLFGTPLEDRQPDHAEALNAISSIQFTPSEKGLLFVTAIFEDTLGLGYLDIQDHQQVQPVKIQGTVHKGRGEFEALYPVKDHRYLLQYNIDGATWLYEGLFDEPSLTMQAGTVICGVSPLANGVMESVTYASDSDRYVLAFSTAISPTQIYTIEGSEHKQVVRHTNERILGIPDELLSAGEDASYISFDGTSISARLYLPSPLLGFSGPRPVVLYVHGGPQGQERPDFAWFSMPLIEFLTLNGFAVFVPNVRGSTGYGLNYVKQVDRDWGGKDRLDHVHAMTQVLPQDPRLDPTRAAVIGRSYGGYMTLTLASRHPELWSAAVDMFGPYNLLTFLDRIPETWKPYFILALGDPEKDSEFLDERSPYTYMDQIRCPLLVMQGKNDPRVIELESRDVVERLRQKGHQVDYVMFENEGHDVLKYENRVTCYNAITEFFKRYLNP